MRVPIASNRGLITVGLWSRAAAASTRTGPQDRSIMERYSEGSSRPSFRTARLITDQVTSTSRTCSTSISQREVSHAHGQIGSNHISTEVLTVMREILPNKVHPPRGDREIGVARRR